MRKQRAVHQPLTKAGRLPSKPPSRENQSRIKLALCDSSRASRLPGVSVRGTSLGTPRIGWRLMRSLPSRGVPGLRGSARERHAADVIAPDGFTRSCAGTGRESLLARLVAPLLREHDPTLNAADERSPEPAYPAVIM